MRDIFQLGSGYKLVPQPASPFRRATGRAPNDNPESGWTADNA